MPVPKKPQHAIGQLTTYELDGYRKNLEHALETMPEHDRVIPLLRDRLAEVLTEQQARADAAREDIARIKQEACEQPA